MSYEENVRARVYVLPNDAPCAGASPASPRVPAARDGKVQLAVGTIDKEGKPGYLTVFPFLSSISTVFMFDENMLKIWSPLDCCHYHALMIVLLRVRTCVSRLNGGVIRRIPLENKAVYRDESLHDAYQRFSF